jgi:ornithine decarboxylase
MVMATAAVECIAPVTFDNNHTFVTKNPFFEQQQHNGAVIAKEMIGDALRSRVENIDHETCDPGDEDTFFVGDLGEVYRQHMRWKKNLPRVKPFYGKFITSWCTSAPRSIEANLLG